MKERMRKREKKSPGNRKEERIGRVAILAFVN